MRRAWWWPVAVLVGGCAMLTPNVVALTQPPAAGAFTGKGCAVSVAPIDVSGFKVDGKSWNGPESAHALKMFTNRFLGGFTNTDRRNFNPGTTGPVVAHPVLTRAVAGAWFNDAAPIPTELWVSLEVRGESGEVLETMETHVFVDATARTAGFDDRLSEGGEKAGAALGKYLRQQLKCR